MTEFCLAWPNPDTLLSPLTTQEAVLSSRIEGTQATFGEVLKFEAGEEPKEESKRVDIQEIINYRRALMAAIQELKTRPFNLNLLLKLHSILLDSVRGRNKARGQLERHKTGLGLLAAQLRMPSSYRLGQMYFPSSWIIGKSTITWIVQTP
jgi:Fic family protein